MSLDLKSDWSDADLAKLMGAVKDDREWRLEVSREGIVKLHDMSNDPTGADYDDGLHGYFETWSEGTDFVGASAAADKELVGKIAKALRENYPTRKSGDKFIYVAF